jgi:hypothetical protein
MIELINYGTFSSKKLKFSFQNNSSLRKAKDTVDH